MKKNIFLIAAAALLALASCYNGPEYGDAVFMTGTLSSPKVKFLHIRWLKAMTFMLSWISLL